MNMASKRFSNLFLLAAFVIFLGSGRNVPSSILLILASIYKIIDAVSDYRKGGQ